MYTLIQKLYNGTISSIERELLTKVVNNHVQLSKVEGQPTNEFDHVLSILTPAQQ